MDKFDEEVELMARGNSIDRPSEVAAWGRSLVAESEQAIKDLRHSRHRSKGEII